MKKFSKLAIVALFSAALLGVFALAGCSGEPAADSTDAAPGAYAANKAVEEAGPVELQIFAANSLQKALPEVQALYTSTYPNVTFADSQFEASGTLVSKLQSGATADVLITASKKTMDNAVTNGSIDEATRIDMFKNDLVIITKEGSTLAISSVDDLATDAVSSFAIGDPNSVPAGKYALQTLAAAGLVTYDEADDGTVSNVVWDVSVAGKVNAGADKVGTVASYVSEGTVECGFVYTSDVYRYKGVQSAYTTPADSHKAIIYPGAVCTDAKSAIVAADFIAFCMTNPDAQAIFSQYGFELA